MTRIFYFLLFILFSYINIKGIEKIRTEMGKEAFDRYIGQFIWFCVFLYATVLFFCQAVLDSSLRLVLIHN